MAITLQDGAANASLDAIVDLIDVGTPNGTLEFKSAASTVAGTNEVATINFAGTAFGAAAARSVSAAATTDDTNAAGGTANNFTIFDGNNLAILQGTVTATSGGGDIELSSITIGAGDTVSLTSLSFSYA